MKTESDDDLRRPFDTETNRLKLLNQTLQSENEFLREELQLALKKPREPHQNLREDTRYSPSNRYDQGYSSVDQLEAKFKRLEEENRMLRLESSKKTPTKLKPLIADVDNDEVYRLNDEIRHLRDTIDKLSRSFTSPSKSKSPSPAKPRPQEGYSPQKQNLHSLYYDRSSEESAMVIERQQAMYDQMMR